MCEEYDQVEVSASVNVSMLQKAEEAHLQLFLGYEESMLVGFLGLYSFVDIQKVEIAGMIHPSFRGEGRFTSLLEEAFQFCEKREAREILLVCPAVSDVARNLMAKLEAVFTFSEYTMEYKHKENAASSKEMIMLEIAKEKDINVIVQLLTDGFDFGATKESVNLLIDRNRTKEGYELFVVKEADTAIATLTVSDEGDSMYISAFTVTPLKRGKGLGKAILQESIQYIIKNHPNKLIRLDVDVKNNNGLKLYEDVGFKKVSGYDYFKYEHKKSKGLYD